MVLGFCIVACSTSEKKPALENGDLLFQGVSSSQLSEAIDKVTQTEIATHFSHVGLVELASNGELFVLHAEPEKGSCRVPIREFLEADEDSLETIVYRLKEPYRKGILDAIAQAKTMLGKPYNFTYVLSDSTHYCSEFVYKAFALDSVFRMNPMSFKDPDTGEFFPLWIQHYEKYGIPIPEGLPGCNPNGMAASDKLTRLGSVTEFQY